MNGFEIPEVVLNLPGPKSEGGMRLIDREMVTDWHRVYDVFSDGSALVSDMSEQEHKNWLDFLDNRQRNEGCIAPNT